MSGVLRQSTSTVLSFGPFVSPTDGVTLVTSLVSALDHVSTGIMLSKNGGALAVRHATVTATTYDAYGNYLVTLDATDTGTVGRLCVQFAAAASCLPVWRDFDVITQSAYDALFGSSAVGYATPTNITAASGISLTSGERTSVADAMLDRDMSVGTDSGSTTVRTVRQALRVSRNKVSITAGTMTVTKEDDVTTSHTAAVTTDATAAAIVSIDPAGP